MQLQVHAPLVVVPRLVLILPRQLVVGDLLFLWLRLEHQELQDYQQVLRLQEHQVRPAFRPYQAPNQKVPIQPAITP